MARQSEWDALEAIAERRCQILNIIGPMMVGFKAGVTKMRGEGATETEIEAMLVEIEERYAFGRQCRR